MAEQTVTTLERRLSLAHTARRAKEHQLDGIRRALCDAGFMQDDDPYGHADLADVIRQVGGVRPGLTDAERVPDEQCATCLHPKQLHPDTTYRSPCMATYNVGADICDCMAYKETGTIEAESSSVGCPLIDAEEPHRAHYWRGRDRVLSLHCPGWAPRPSPAPCGINHDCPGQVRPVPLTALSEARCQSQRRREGEPLVQCARPVHAGDAHTDYSPSEPAPPGRNPELPWLAWRDGPEEGCRN